MESERQTCKNKSGRLVIWPSTNITVTRQHLNTLMILFDMGKADRIATNNREDQEIALTAKLKIHKLNLRE